MRADKGAISRADSVEPGCGNSRANRNYGPARQDYEPRADAGSGFERQRLEAQRRVIPSAGPNFGSPTRQLNGKLAGPGVA